MKYIFCVLFLSVVFLSCETKPGKKGDIIPPNTVLKNPINAVKTVKYLSALIEEDENTQLYYLRSKAFFDLHEYSKAYLDIQKAIKGGSDDVDFILLSASIKYQMEWYDAALADLNLLANTNINSDVANQLFVQIYLAKNEVKKAKFFLSRIGNGKINNLNDQILNRLCYGDSLNVVSELNKLTTFQDQSTFVTRFYFQNYHPGKSDLTYQLKLLQVLKKFPSDPHLMRFWARFLFSMHQNDRAEKVYLQVEKLFPENPTVQIELGEFYFRLRNYSKAMEYFSKVPRNAPSYPKALVYKSICLVYKGEKSNGLHALDSLKKLYPNEKYLFNLFARYTNHRFDSLSRPADSLSKMVNQN